MAPSPANANFRVSGSTEIAAAQKYATRLSGWLKRQQHRRCSYSGKPLLYYITAQE
jgi:hypothetical protein